jgi:hypothetical protein
MVFISGPKDRNNGRAFHHGGTLFFNEGVYVISPRTVHRSIPDRKTFQHKPAPPQKATNHDEEDPLGLRGRDPGLYRLQE